VLPGEPVNTPLSSPLPRRGFIHAASSDADFSACILYAPGVFFSLALTNHLQVRIDAHIERTLEHRLVQAPRYIPQCTIDFSTVFMASISRLC
jgi:hypothetical protein